MDGAEGLDFNLRRLSPEDLSCISNVGKDIDLRNRGCAVATSPLWVKVPHPGHFLLTSTTVKHMNCTYSRFLKTLIRVPNTNIHDLWEV